MPLGPKSQGTLSSPDYQLQQNAVFTDTIAGAFHNKLDLETRHSISAYDFMSIDNVFDINDYLSNDTDHDDIMMDPDFQLGDEIMPDISDSPKDMPSQIQQSFNFTLPKPMDNLFTNAKRISTSSSSSASSLISQVESLNSSNLTSPELNPEKMNLNFSDYQLKPLNLKDEIYGPKYTDNINSLNNPFSTDFDEHWSDLTSSKLEDFEMSVLSGLKIEPEREPDTDPNSSNSIISKADIENAFNMELVSRIKGETPHTKPEASHPKVVDTVTQTDNQEEHEFPTNVNYTQHPQISLKRLPTSQGFEQPTKKTRTWGVDRDYSFSSAYDLVLDSNSTNIITSDASTDTIHQPKSSKKYIQWIGISDLTPERCDKIKLLAKKRSLDLQVVEQVICLFQQNQVKEKVEKAIKYGITDQLKTKEGNNSLGLGVVSRWCIDEREFGKYLEICTSSGDELSSEEDTEKIENPLLKVYHPSLLGDDSTSSRIHSGSKTRQKHKNKGLNYVKRPLNSFMLYRKFQIQAAFIYAIAESVFIYEHQQAGNKASNVTERHELIIDIPKLNHQSISQVVALLWKTEEESVKESFAKFSTKEKEIHKIVHPDYKFQPQKRQKS